MVTPAREHQQCTRDIRVSMFVCTYLSVFLVLDLVRVGTS